MTLTLTVTSFVPIIVIEVLLVVNDKNVRIILLATNEEVNAEPILTQSKGRRYNGSNNLLHSKTWFSTRGLYLLPDIRIMSSLIAQNICMVKMLENEMIRYMGVCKNHVIKFKSILSPLPQCRSLNWKHNKLLDNWHWWYFQNLQKISF